MTKFRWDRFTIKTGHFYIVSDNEGHEALLHFRPDESINHFLSNVVEQVNAAIKERATIEEGLVRACDLAEAFIRISITKNISAGYPAAAADVVEKLTAAIDAARGNDGS